MGLPMAANLAKAGHTVRGYDPSAEAMSAAKEAGIKPAKSIADACKKADAVISTLPEDKSRAAFLGEDGIVKNADPKAILIDCANQYVPTSFEIYEAAEKAGFKMLDAPAAGGVSGAASGALTFMVRGEDPAFLEGEPFLAPMAKKIFHHGPVYKEAKKFKAEEGPKVIYKKTGKWKGAAVIVLLLFFGGNAVFYALIEDAIKMRDGRLTVTLDLGPTETKILCRGTSLIGLDIDGC